ncbi:MAG TPA: hypothetical protein VME46_25220 [Acidimicrobiales bacterium]|nr:hypothetical protein [Acidimicrobiales bacterium]
MRIACIGWPVVVRASAVPRWTFFRLALIVTLALWLLDGYILHRGQPPRAVGVLFAMHQAIALATYNVVVQLAPPRPERRHLRPAVGQAGGSA